MDLLLASNNDHKRVELQGIVHAHRIRTPAELGIPFDFEETAETFVENALGKALALRDLLLERSPPEATMPIIADDSGLCVDALGGRPGVRSARYGSPDGGRTELAAADRNDLLLGELRDSPNRSAHFVCCMVGLFDRHRFVVAQETFDGVIAAGPAGAGGFGYDPIFFLPEYGRTVAELPDTEKNRISHRGRAAAALVPSLEWMVSATR